MNKAEKIQNNHNVLLIGHFPWWIIALCFLISLSGITDHDLWTPDEPREAAIALKMGRTGNIVIPKLAEEPFVEKPPLYYIVASSALSLFGRILGNTPALRLTSALWGLGTLCMTWLLAKRLMNRKLAVLAMLVLAATPGFIHVTHWLLVDNALVFFVVAALWSFSEAYEGNRFGYLPLAGLFTAGAFLSKGLIGPVIIAIGWFGLAIPWMLRRGCRSAFKLRSVGFHVFALLIFACAVLSWVVALRVVGGPDLWHEWFWENQVGRFSGQAIHLGHINGPFYYLGIIPVYLLPWIVVLIPGLVSITIRIWREKRLPQPWLFLLCWGVGGLLLLSLASTKREIYLIILLPAFAMIIALTLSEFANMPQRTIWKLEKVRKWVCNLLIIWSWCILGILALVALAPLFIHGFMLFAPDVGQMANGIIDGWSLMNTVAVGALACGIIIMTTKTMPFLNRLFSVTALSYIIILALLCPAIDRVKSYGSAFRQIGYAVTAHSDEKVAAWNLDETTRAGFYYYCDLVFPDISNIVDLNSILDGTHNRFSGVMVCANNFPPRNEQLPPWSVVFQVHMGPRRVLKWIKGEGR